MICYLTLVITSSKNFVSNFKNIYIYLDWPLRFDNLSLNYRKMKVYIHFWSLRWTFTNWTLQCRIHDKTLRGSVTLTTGVVGVVAVDQGSPPRESASVLNLYLSVNYCTELLFKVTHLRKWRRKFNNVK